jgi:hypothetical protein
MNDQPRAFPFRWVLPLSQLAVCFLALLILGRYDAQKRPPGHAVPAGGEYVIRTDDGGYVKIRIPNRKPWQVWASQERFQAVSIGLSLPSMILQLPYVFLNPEKREWVPRGMFFWEWRAISWPVIGVLFWWAAGRGLKAVMAARRGIIRPAINWVETVIATALFVIFGGLCICALANRIMGSDTNSAIGFVGCVLWAILTGVMIAARIAQWRIRVASPAT